ncbi:type I polyketide synthase [Psychromicrobium lacuslunae]|uniref:Ketosynthase family 3 (KS3) domain-containing protein n=1 Tax=Psychromicrobium lacuslunae TaxID=1618207 RepID=A0A0D4C147_9MICC|nr:type I polyketide synthase [Psychromicrobium lacuslunae]AJT42061.1 hypothetical protein UM93_12080 [Psychromicrobium lacuslunae]
MQQPIAVVGMAAFFPGAKNLQEFRDNLFAGTDAISEVPEGRWQPELYHPEASSEPASSDRFYCRRGGFVADFPEVSVARFGIMPSSIEGAEPDQLIALEMAAAALADAGAWGPEGLVAGLDRSRVGIVLGRGGYLAPGVVRLNQRVRTAHQLVSTLRQLMPDLTEQKLDKIKQAFLEQLGPDRPDTAIGLVPNLAASRVANRLDLRGPAYTVDGACASSLLAVDHAVQELESGRCDLVLAGGVHHAHDVTLWSVFTQLRALSVAQQSRPFDAESDGILIGEGTGVLAFKRLEDAVRDGDRVYATIRGSGVASDGRTSSLMNPDPGGQSRAVRSAWQQAGIDPAGAASVGLIEAHGTGTPAGDASELTTLAEVFGAADPVGPKPVIGSVKSMIGHAMPAAGAAGLIKAVLAVYHGVLPPTLGISQPHPGLATTRFAPLSQPAEWATDPRQPLRRAGVNAFGFGGINAHLVVEQLPGQAAQPVLIGTELFDADGVRSAPSTATPVPALSAAPVLLLSADSVPELQQILALDDDELVGKIGADPGTGAVRLAILAPGKKQLSMARKAVSRGKAWHGRGDVWFRPGPLSADSERAGVGNQAGLGSRSEPLGSAELAFVCPGLEAEFKPNVADVISHFGLPPLRGAAGAGADGGATELVGNTQLQGSAVLQVSRILAAALQQLGVQPDAVAGHSVGEWAAMVLGGIYDSARVDEFLDASGMSDAQFPGLSFAVIGAPAQQVLAELAGQQEVVLSHDNSPLQSMICGPEDEVAELVQKFRAQGHVSRVLPFVSGFHTPMFAQYLDQLENLTGNLEMRAAQIPVWSATTVAPFPDDQQQIREIFVRHLLETVRFRELIEQMYQAGHRIFVQLGPGQMGSLITDTLGEREHLVVSANSAQRQGLDQLRNVLAALWSCGRQVDLSFLGVNSVAATGSVEPAAEREAARRTGPLSRLDLTSPVTKLSEQAAAALASELAAQSNQPSSTAVKELANSGNLNPQLATELSALLAETNQLVDSVMSAALKAPSQAQPAIQASPSLAEPPTSIPQAVPVAVIAPALDGPSQPAIPSQPSPPEPRSLEISLQTMPHLADHSFFSQRADWPEFSDRFPVVPGTTIIRLLMDEAERLSGQHAVAVHSVRFNQWVELTEPRRLEITASWIDDSRLAMSFGGFSHCTVELAEHYNVPESEPWLVNLETEGPSGLTEVSEMYSKRWMFHGPQYQGIVAVHGVGPEHIRGRIVAKPAPGALLDNVGQLAGYWLMSRFTERSTVFPAGMQTIKFFGPDPAPGSEIDCLLRITEVNDDFFQADGQLLHDGKIWCELTGWQDRRFDSAPNIRQMDEAIEHHAFAHPQPGGWVLMPDYWPDLASRDLTMRKYLAKQERLEHQASAPRGRRQRLLGKVALKDAVRLELWKSQPGQAIFPAEIAIDHLASGQPVVAGLHGRELPELDVSVAHCEDLGVAMVRRRKDKKNQQTQLNGVGIDLEVIGHRSESFREIAFTENERELLGRLEPSALGAEDAIEAQAWPTRFWAAKEAVGKALGTGLAGKPRQFEIVAVHPGDASCDFYLEVSAALRRQLVAVRTIENPEKLPERKYVVAWTTDSSDYERTSR